MSAANKMFLGIQLYKSWVGMFPEEKAPVARTKGSKTLEISGIEISRGKKRLRRAPKGVKKLEIM